MSPLFTNLFELTKKCYCKFYNRSKCKKILINHRDSWVLPSLYISTSIIYTCYKNTNNKIDSQFKSMTYIMGNKAIVLRILRCILNTVFHDICINQQWLKIILTILIKWLKHFLSGIMVYNKFCKPITFNHQ